MATRKTEQPALSAGNKLYLYQILSKHLGFGKQTFATRVEEALAAEGLSVGRMGYASTRTFLEAIDEFADLTTFKGGRVYATIRQIPEWDSALEASSAPSKGGPAGGAAKGNKPWKRKKGVRGLKPVRPKQAPLAEEAIAEEAEPEAAKDSMGAASMAVEIAAEKDAADQAPTIPSATGPADTTADENAADQVPEVAAASTTDLSPVDAAVDQAPEAAATASEAIGEPPVSEEAAPAAQEEPRGISLTITYDPYTGSEQETTLAIDRPRKEEQPQKTHDDEEVTQTRPQGPVSTVETAEPAAPTVVEAAPQPAQARPAQSATSSQAQHTQRASGSQALPAQPAADSQAQPARPVTNSQAPQTPSPAALKDYPRDFMTDVQCPANLLGELVRIVPMGANAIALLEEDFRVAKSLETLRGSRSHVEFPLRYAGDGGAPVRIGLKRGSGVHGTIWIVDAISGASKELLAASGIHGLPLASDGPWMRADDAAGSDPFESEAMGESPLRRFALAVATPSHTLRTIGDIVYPDLWSEHLPELRRHLALAYARAQRVGSLKQDGSRMTFPTGLLTSGAKEIAAIALAHDDDIPWVLSGFSEDE